MSFIKFLGTARARFVPWVVADELEKELGLTVLAPSDGLKLDLKEVG
jgi:hypothetical protein